MSIEALTPGDTSGVKLSEADLLALGYLHEEPGEGSSDVAFRIALAMAGLTEFTRTRPLTDILQQDHPAGQGVGERTYGAIMALVAEHGYTSGDDYAADTQNASVLKTVA